MSLKICINNTWEIGHPVDHIYQNAEIRNFTLSAQIDVSCQSMPYNSMSFELRTDESLTDGKLARVYIDDTDRRIMEWPIYSSQRLDDKNVKITCRSWLSLLYDRKLDERLPDEYSDEALYAALSELNVNFDSLKPGETVKAGHYYPDQSVRERIIWYMFTEGRYIVDYAQVKDYEYDNISNIEYNEFSQYSTLIPLEATFRNAKFSYRHRINRLLLHYYDFTKSTWLMVDDESFKFPEPWIALEGVASSINAPADDIGNGEDIIIENPSPPDESTNFLEDLEIENIFAVSMGNATDILGRLCDYYLNPRDLTVDVMDGFAYRVGDRVTVYTAVDKLVSGIITRADYTVVMNERATLTLAGVVDVPGEWVKFEYTLDGVVFGHDYFYFPVGYIDKSGYLGKHRLYRYKNGELYVYMHYGKDKIIRTDDDVTVKCPFVDMYRD